MTIKQLRILSTVLLGFAVGQAGLGSGYLNHLDNGGHPLLIAHATNAFAVAVLTVLAAVFGFSFRRAGGPAWVFFLPLLLVVGAGTQLTLGFARILGGHVFVGVLFLCVATAYCSYTWRYRAPAPAAPAAPAAQSGAEARPASAPEVESASAPGSEPAGPAAQTPSSVSDPADSEAEAADDLKR